MNHSNILNWPCLRRINHFHEFFTSSKPMLVDVAGWRSSPNSSARARVSTVWIVILASKYIIIVGNKSCGLTVDTEIPGSSALRDALVHVLALVQVDHLALVKKIGVKTEKAKLPGSGQDLPLAKTTSCNQRNRSLCSTCC